MSYEVTKRIKGRDYRYRVEATRDAETGRGGTRWVYLGKVAGGELVAPERARSRRVTHDEIVALTAELIEARDVSRVTVAVIAHHAGISSGTFYRHFGDRDAVLAAALALLAERCIAELPALDTPIGDFAGERTRLNRWFEGLHAAVLHGRALRWFLTSSAHDKIEETIRRGEAYADPRELLATYFAALHHAGLAHIPEPLVLAGGIMTLHGSVIRDMALHDDADAATRWAEVFPVIERAVFGEKNFITAP